MCSVSGFKVINPERYKNHVEEVRHLMSQIISESSIRGWQSTGFMSFDTKFHYGKSIKRPEEFVEESVAYHKAINSRTKVFVAHTRWPSTGVVKRRNAHPFVGDYFAMVHNGVVPEFPYLKDKRLGWLKDHFEVDSEVILYMLERDGNCSFLVDKLIHSNYALVFLRKDDGKVFFVRKDAPLCLVVIMKYGVIFWASTKSIIEIAFTNSGLFPAYKKLKTYTLFENEIYSFEGEGSTLHRCKLDSYIRRTV